MRPILPGGPYAAARRERPLEHEQIVHAVLERAKRPAS
jgi:hypothetical protein